MEDNKTLARRFIEAMGRGDVATIDALMAEDATWWTAGSTPVSGTIGKKAFIEMISNVPAMTKDMMHFTFGDFTAEEDRVCIEATNHADLTSGKSYDNSYHFLFRFESGLVKAVKEYMDTDHVVKTFT